LRNRSRIRRRNGGAKWTDKRKGNKDLGAGVREPGKEGERRPCSRIRREASEWMPRWWLVPAFPPAMSRPIRLPEPPLLAFLSFPLPTRIYDIHCGPSLGLMGLCSTTNTPVLEFLNIFLTSVFVRLILMEDFMESFMILNFIPYHIVRRDKEKIL
jgi:hypothetical protein